MSFTVLQSRAYWGFSARLKYPQSLILAAIRGVTPRCPSEVEVCPPRFVAGRAGVSNLYSEVPNVYRESLMEISGIPRPGHKTDSLSQSTTHFIELVYLLSFEKYLLAEFTYFSRRSEA